MPCWKCVACGQSIMIDDVQLGFDFRRYNQGYMCRRCFPESNALTLTEVPMKVRLFDPGRSTRITGTSRQFGVELETFKSYGYRNITSVFTAKPDGSVSGLEFVSPPLKNDNGLAAIEEFCLAALSQDVSVDWSCGFHTHIECTENTDVAIGNVFDAYRRSQNMWHSLVPGERRNTSYCRSFDTHSVNTIVNQHRLGQPTADYNNVRNTIRHTLGGRYWWLNFASLSEHGTYEVRLHQGCLNPHKINAWVLAHLRFIDTVSSMDTEELNSALPVSSSFDQVFEVIGNDKLKRYWEKRKRMYVDCNDQTDDLGLVAGEESWLS